MSKLMVGFAKSVGVEFTVGDVFSKCGIKSRPDDDCLKVINNEKHFDSWIVESFAQRKNEGEQPCGDDLPVVVFNVAGNDNSDIAKEFCWHYLKDKYCNVETWKPDINELIKMQDGHDEKPNEAKEIFGKVIDPYPDLVIQKQKTTKESKMIDLRNTWIYTKDSELVTAYLECCEKQGITWCCGGEKPTEWDGVPKWLCSKIHTKDLILSNGGVNMSSAEVRQITLEDLKPKRTKTEFVKVDSSEAVHYFTDISTLLYSEPSEMSSPIEIQDYIDNLAAGEDCLYRKVEREITWQEALQDHINSLENMPAAITQLIPLSLTKWQCELVKISHLIASMTDKPE